MPRPPLPRRGRALQAALALLFLALFLGSLAWILKLEVGKPAGRPRAPAEGGRIPTPPAPVRVPTAEEQEQAAWTDLEARLATLLERSDYGTALNEIAWFRPASAAGRERLRTLETGTRSAARAAMDRLVASARAHAAEQRYVEAMQALEKLREFHIPEFLEEVSAEAELWSKEQRKQARRAELPRLGRVLIELEPLLRGRKLKEAETLIERARREAPALAMEVDYLRGSVVEAMTIFTAIGGGAKKMMGEEIEVEGGKGTIVKADAETVHVRRADGSEVGVRYEDLPPGTFVRVLRAAGMDDDYAAHYLFFSGRVEEARKAWADSPIRAQYEAVAEQVTEARRLARGGIEEGPGK